MPSCAGIKTEARAEKIFALTSLKKIFAFQRKMPPIEALRLCHRGHDVTICLQGQFFTEFYFAAGIFTANREALL